MIEHVDFCIVLEGINLKSATPTNDEGPVLKKCVLKCQCYSHSLVLHILQFKTRA